jgi:uncharacterized protein (TIGR00369 family)
MDGLSYVRAIADGTFPAPPVARMLGFDIPVVERGRVVFAMEAAEWMYNPIGSVHGGIAATILDSCLGCAIHTVLDVGTRYTTTDLHVRYIRPMSADTGRVLAEGTVTHSGRRIATAEGRLVSVRGETLFAHATTGCAILVP